MNKKKSLAETHPEISKEVDGWDADSISAGSQKTLSWICKRGHQYLATPEKRTKRGQGCPFCANKKVLRGFNDLATTNPKIASEAHLWDPSTVTEGSKKIVDWRCPQNHIYSTPVNRRSTRNGRRKQSGCPVCANRSVIFGVNDLLTTNPDLAREALNWDPSTVSSGSGKKLDWKCNRGHTFQATVNHRNRGTGCPICNGQKIQVGFNDLATTHPSLALEAHNWDPRTRSATSGWVADWTCSRGHTYRSRIIHRRDGSGCPYCANYKLLTGFNDLKTIRPDLALQAFEWDPSQVVSGSAKKMTWICESAHTWRATVDSRMSGRGCPTCANSGFDPNEDGWLYFLKHFEWELFQIGITNSPKDRLRTHSRLGWELIELRGPMDGHLVQQWETAILRHIRTNGGKMADKIGVEPFDGYSESWLKESFSSGSLKEIMDVVDQQED